MPGYAGGRAPALWRLHRFSQVRGDKLTRGRRYRHSGRPRIRAGSTAAESLSVMRRESAGVGTGVLRRSERPPADPAQKNPVIRQVLCQHSEARLVQESPDIPYDRSRFATMSVHSSSRARCKIEDATPKGSFRCPHAVQRDPTAEHRLFLLVSPAPGARCITGLSWGIGRNRSTQPQRSSSGMDFRGDVAITLAECHPLVHSLAAPEWDQSGRSCSVRVVTADEPAKSFVVELHATEGARTRLDGEAPRAAGSLHELLTNASPVYRTRYIAAVAARFAAAVQDGEE